MNNKDFEPSKWAEFMVNIARNLGYVADESGVTVGKSLINLFTVFAPAVAPLGPAIMFSANFFAGAVGEVGSSWAFWAAVAVGIALECAGIIAAKTAVRYLNEWQKDREARTKLGLSVGIVGIYFMAGIGTTFLENTPSSMKWLTVISFTIALIVYGASALYEDAERNEKETKKQQSLENRAEEEIRVFELEEARKDREAKRMLAMRRQEQRGELAHKKLELPVVAQAVSPASAPVMVSKKEGYTGWRKIPNEVKLTFATMSVANILEDNPDITERTAQNWIARSKEMKQ